MNNLFYKNEYIFSEIYLQEITQVEEDREVLAKLSVIKEYKDFSDSSSLSKWNSSFIYEVLNALAFSHEIVNDNVTLLKQIGKPENISLCFSVLPVEDINNTSMGRNWAEKTIRYLKTNNLRWGILTNGNKWRIYHTEESTPYENYLEIELDKILENNEISQYQIFHKFMKADNFVLEVDNKCKFDIYKKESQDKIDYIEEELKNALKQREGENGKGILSDLCMGYVEFLRSQGINNFKDEDLRKTIYAGAMLYMFRLLFIFYATARNLLKDDDTKLFSIILNKCNTDIKNGISDKNEFNIWDSLRIIYSNIDLTYNGGLFDPRENYFSDFIENNRISDYYLSRVIYYLNYFEDLDNKIKPISYRDMSVRHLGTLYEGLLEHKLFVAEEDTEVKISKEGIKFIPESEGGRLIEGKYISKGQVYFGTDKKERKSTGSYYTPENIVDYIVSNTVGIKLEELGNSFYNNNKNNYDAYRNSINVKENKAFTELIYNNIKEFVKNDLLKLSVLDPAMGSGHFLINAVLYITNFITKFLNEYNINTDYDTSSIIWKRRVVENCIYGVDKNPLAIELAKLSLWILSMSKDKPLTFLNHHLKCGNSLIGTELMDVGNFPDYSKPRKSNKQLSVFHNNPAFKRSIENAIEKYLKIEDQDTYSMEDIDNKSNLLSDINEELLEFKQLCDFHTSIYLGNEIKEQEYSKIIKNPKEINHLNSYNYFHWEIEFPEIFLKNKGFDCIIGNPPYVVLKGGRYTNYEAPEEELLYYRYFYETAEQQINSYTIFLEKSTYLMKNNSLTSFIIPNTILTNDYSQKIRLFLLDNTQIKIINNVGIVFKNATVETIIICFTTPYLNNEIFCFFKNTQNSILQSEFNNFYKKRFLIHLSKNNLSIIKKMSEKPKKIKDYCEVWMGISTGNDSKYLFRYPNGTNPKKALQGKDIQRYKINYNDLYVDYVRDELDRPRPESVFLKKEKLVSKFVSKDLIFAYDNMQYYVMNTGCALINKDNHNFDIKYFLGLLNSDLLTFYFQNYFTDYRDVFPIIKSTHIEELPIPKIDLLDKTFKNIYTEIIKNVNNILNDIEVGKSNENINELVLELYGIKINN